MTEPKPRRSPNPSIGARIRDRRLALELKQGALAQAAGISASYLNLIEHNKRRIGGKLLIDIAHALDVEPASLSAGPEASVFEALHETASRQAHSATPPELDRIDGFLSRFPGWAEAVAAQNREISSLEAVNETLRDRLRHDTVLADAMHELISTAAAIRSTAGILVEDEALEPQWRTRFTRNLNEEAERLADRATALIRHLETEQDQDQSLVRPGDMVERFLDQNRHHFPQIEAGGAEAVPALLDETLELNAPETRALAEAHLQAYAGDAARLPLEPFLEAATQARFRPDRLYALAGGDVALVLRRLASLPPEVFAPDFGLAVCNASGELLRRRRHPVHGTPGLGGGVPIWPLYRALGRPLLPDQTEIALPQGGALMAWTVCQSVGLDPHGAPELQATMLIGPVPEADG